MLVDVPADAEIAQEEIFGPVAAITPSTTEAEVIAAANDTEYGLVAYVYTGDLARGLRVSEKLESGHGRAQPRSGLRSGGAVRRRQAERARAARAAHHGIVEFCETKYIAVSW